jgi:hypothetical protein
MTPDIVATRTVAIRYTIPRYAGAKNSNMLDLALFLYMLSIMLSSEMGNRCTSVSPRPSTPTTATVPKTLRCFRRVSAKYVHTPIPTHATANRIRNHNTDDETCARIPTAMAATIIRRALSENVKRHMFTDSMIVTSGSTSK